VKFRYSGFSAFITAFDAKTDEFNYFQEFEALQQSKYTGKGVELESGYHIGGFHINVGQPIPTRLSPPPRILHWLDNLRIGSRNSSINLAPDIRLIFSTLASMCRRKPCDGDRQCRSE